MTTWRLWRHIPTWKYQKAYFSSFSTTFPIFFDRFRFDQVIKWSLRLCFFWDEMTPAESLPSKSTQTPIFLAFRSYFQSFSTIFYSMKSWNVAFAVILIFTLPFQVDMKPARSYRYNHSNTNFLGFSIIFPILFDHMSFDQVIKWRLRCHPKICFQNH